jgi:hypothetical protein
MVNKREKREPEGRTEGRSWAGLVGNLGEAVAQVPLLTAQLGTSLVRNLTEALDDFVGGLMGGQEPAKRAIVAGDERPSRRPPSPP